MKALKILFYITMTLFFIIGIVVIYNNTNFWKNQIYLSCEFSGEHDGFSLVINKKEKAVLWQGKTADIDKERKLNAFTDVSVEMSWVADLNEMDIDLNLDRLTGNFIIVSSKLKKQVHRDTGRCVEKQKRF